MGAYEQVGWYGSGTVGASPLVANTGVVFAAGLLVAAGAGQKAIGIVKTAAAAGSVVAYTRVVPGTEQLVATSGVVVADDFVKWTTGGLLVADTTSGATALSVNTVAQLRTTPDANGNAWAVFI